MAAINESVVERGSRSAVSRGPHRGMLVSATAILLVAIASIGVVIVRSSTSTPAGQRSVVTSKSKDQAVRDLVARGLVPAARLDDGTQIANPALVPPSRDDIVRDLVARRLVPAATLDDGTHIVSPEVGS